MSRTFSGPRAVQEMRKAFDDFRKDVKPTQKEYSRWADAANRARMDGFDDEIGPDGTSWPALAESTIKQKRRGSKPLKARKGNLYRGKTRKPSPTPEKPLQDQGYLKKAVSGATNEKGYVRLAQSRSLPVWNGKSISQIHNEKGNGQKWRPHWGFYPKGVEFIEREWQAKVKAAMGKYL